MACGTIEIPPIEAPIDAGAEADASGPPITECMRFDPWPFWGKACASDTECGLSTDPCAPAACMSGQCVQLDPGEGQPGVCRNGGWCRYLDGLGPPYGCCAEPPTCIYDAANNCAVTGLCAAGLWCNADGFCCH